MSAAKLKVERRTTTGKGSSRRIRREGNIPGVLYGPHIDTQHLIIPGHDLFLIVKENQNALLELSLDGEKQLALVKDIQHHPVRRDILHVDLLAVKRGEKVEVDVPVTLVGEPAAGTTATLDEFTLTLHADALNIPEEIVVNIDGLDDGTVITFADITLPEGTEADYDDETVICSIAFPQQDIETETPEVAEGEQADEASDASAE